MIRSIAFLLLACAPAALAFVGIPVSSSACSNSALFGYVPDGLTKEQYEKIKQKERQAQQNLGKVGLRGFKSRSMQSFQEAMERGETTHLMPVFNAKERIAKGELKLKDIPYMQRGGAWDNSDVKGAKRMKWLASDKEYANGGFKKEQSVSILGSGAGLDWTGTKSRSGPVAKTPKNYKPPNVKDLSEKKGLFGLW